MKVRKSKMTIYDFVNSITDCWNIVFTLFDCNKEDLVSVETDDGETTQLEATELLYSEYADYEIGGTDMWIDDGKIHIEFNIEIDEDEY
jgi:hypothetical protein